MEDEGSLYIRLVSVAVESRGPCLSSFCSTSPSLRWSPPRAGSRAPGLAPPTGRGLHPPSPFRGGAGNGRPPGAALPASERRVPAMPVSAGRGPRVLPPPAGWGWGWGSGSPAAAATPGFCLSPQAYHSTLMDPDTKLVGNMALLPIRSQFKGPAPRESRCRACSGWQRRLSGSSRACAPQEAARSRPSSPPGAAGPSLRCGGVGGGGPLLSLALRQFKASLLWEVGLAEGSGKARRPGEPPPGKAFPGWLRPRRDHGDLRHLWVLRSVASFKAPRKPARNLIGARSCRGSRPLLCKLR